MSKVNFLFQSGDGEVLRNDLPIEVRKTNMALVERAMASRTLELEPSTYVVSTRLPAGREIHQVVNVAAGEPTTVTIRLEGSADAELPRRNNPVTVRGGTERKVLEPLGFGGRDAGPAGLRFLAANPFQQPPSPREYGVSSARPIQPTGVSLQIQVGDKPLLVQMLQPGAPTINIVLPAWRSDCTLNILRSSAGGGVEVRLADKNADNFVRFDVAGQLTEAHTIMTEWLNQAKTTFWSEESDPIAGLVGAYALLRFNDLDNLNDWMANLDERSARLPDSLVVRMEYLARLGRHEEAFRCLLEMPARGLPIFSRGLALAINRLKFYLGSIGERASVAERHEAMDALNLFDRFRPFVDFDQPVTMFTGLDPHRPDAKPLSEIKGKPEFSLSKWF